MLFSIMRAIICNIITFYEMRAKALSVFVANTQKILKESERKGKADDQAEKIENFIKNLTMEVNNMLTRFYFQKEHEQMTDDQRKALVDFVNFVETLTKSVQSLLRRYQKSQTFEEKIDKEMKELEAHFKQRLKEFDEALNGRDDTLTSRLNKCVGDVLSRARKPFRGSSFSNRLNANAASNSIEK